MLVRLAVGFLALDLVALAYTLEYDLLLVLLYDLGWAIFSLLYAVISVILVHRRSSVLAATEDRDALRPGGIARLRRARVPNLGGVAWISHAIARSTNPMKTSGS